MKQFAIIYFFLAFFVKGVSAEEENYLAKPAIRENVETIFKEVVAPKYNVDQKLKGYIFDFPLSNYEIAHVGKESKFFIDLDKKNDRIKSGLLQNIPWEDNIFNMMKGHIRQGTIILDAGAHIGTHTINLAKANPEGIIYAFEVQPKIFRELFFNLFLNDVRNVKLFPVALGAENGKVELSTLQEGNEGATVCRGHSGIMADLITIDSLNLNNISVMKIDVEGMENEVLAGAKETIVRNKPIIFIEFTRCDVINEKNEMKRQEGMKKIKQLEDLGYFVQNIFGHDYVAYPIRGK